MLAVAVCARQSFIRGFPALTPADLYGKTAPLVPSKRRLYELGRTSSGVKARGWGGRGGSEEVGGAGGWHVQCAISFYFRWSEGGGGVTNGKIMMKFPRKFCPIVGWGGQGRGFQRRVARLLQNMRVLPPEWSKGLDVAFGRCGLGVRISRPMCVVQIVCRERRKIGYRAERAPA